MKLLVGIDSYFESYGGPWTAISQKLEYLNKANIDFKLIFSSNNHFKYKLNFKEIVKKFDIVHIYGLWKPFTIKLFSEAKRSKKTIIISPLGALEPWALSQKKIKKKIAWHLYQKKIMLDSDYIHATSEIEKEHLIELGIEEKKIIIIGHGIKFDENLRKSFNYKKKKMIYFSRIHEKKGLLELISIWDQLKNSHNWKLEIYGPVSNTKYLNTIKKRIRLKNLENEIKIFQPIFNNEEKKKIFLKSDCFILPSKSENFGISIAESLSYGLPVLTTKDTPWEIINENNAGYVFDFSEKNLIYYIDKYMSLNSSQIEKMSIRARNIIKDKFDEKKIFKSYVNFYKSIFTK